MNLSGLHSSSSPIKGSSSQYIPSLFATNAQSASSGASGNSDKGATSAGQDENERLLDKYSHMAFDRQQQDQRLTAKTVATTTATGARPPFVPVGRANADPNTSTNPQGASPSPVSTVDYADIEQKQTELRSAVEHRIHSLENTLVMRDEEIARLRAQLRKMEEDYQFNYNLINERDAALEEAAQQLQRLYREMKRVTNEGSVLEKKLQAADGEVGELKKRVREAEAARESTVSQVRKEYLIKEQHLLQATKAKEAALEEERQKSHEEYMKMVKQLEESKAEVEGRTASASSQLEQRHKQVVQRLENEIERLQTRLQAADADTLAAQTLVGKLKEQHATLQHQMDLTEQRHATALEELRDTNQKLETQLAQTNSLLNKSLTTAEDAIREETQRSNRLELENTGLQSRIAEVKAQLQEMHNKQTEDARSFAEERRAMQANYQSALSTMEETERKWRDGERVLQSSLADKSAEVAKLTRKLQEMQQEQQAEREGHAASKANEARLQQEVDRLDSEVQRWKDEEAKTAASARHEKALAEEKHLALERALQEARDENERQRRKAYDAQERSQAEAARLTRELHSSEAARRALEDQFHLAEDRNGQNALINGLRYEKVALERRVMELERTNGEIRDQVANFTLELQNDPTVKSARETQRKVQELQQDLLAARDETQRLRDAMAEKEEEVARYQVDILRAQMLLGGGGGTTAQGGVELLASLGHQEGLGAGPAATLSTSAAAILRQQQEQLRGEWATMRERLEKGVSGGGGGGGRKGKGRHLRRRASSSSSSSSRSSSASSSRSRSTSGSSTGSSTDAEGKGRRKHRGRGRRHRQGHRIGAKRGAIADLPASPATNPTASVPPPAAEDDGKAVRNSYLLQEAEVWRQKSLQLEQHLHTVLRERDQLRRDLGLAKQDISALSSEKQSLLDLNSLLKAQLREAYRTSYESFTRATNGAPPLAPSTTSGRELPPPEWVAAAVAAIAEQQQEQQQQRPPRHPRSTTTATATTTLPPPSASPIPSAPASRSSHGSRGPSQPRKSGSSATLANPYRGSGAANSNAGLNASTTSSHVNHYHNTSGGTTASSTGGASSSALQRQQQQRLAELEEEIQRVRGQITSTTTAARKQQDQHQHQRLSAKDGAPVVRRGGVTVRHYGYN